MPTTRAFLPAATVPSSTPVAITNLARTTTRTGKLEHRMGRPAATWIMTDTSSTPETGALSMSMAGTFLPTAVPSSMPAAGTAKPARRMARTTASPARRTARLVSTGWVMVMVRSAMGVSRP